MRTEGWGHRTGLRLLFLRLPLLTSASLFTVCHDAPPFNFEKSLSLPMHSTTASPSAVGHGLERLEFLEGGDDADGVIGMIAMYVAMHVYKS